MVNGKPSGEASRSVCGACDATIVPEEHAEATASQWNATLTATWGKPHLTLSAAVHWIATKGVKREANLDELEQAATQLLNRIREGKIAVSAVNPDTGKREIVSAVEFADDQPFYGDESLFDRAAPTLRWNTEIEDDRSDDFETRAGQIVWRDLRVDRAKVQKEWPVVWAAPADKRRAGRPGDKRMRIVEAMLRDLNSGLFDLAGAKQTELEERYKGLGEPSRKTCNDARTLALFKIQTGNF